MKTLQSRSMRNLSVALVALAFLTNALPHTHTNFALPYDRYAKRMGRTNNTFKAGVTLEHGLNSDHSYDGSGQKVGLFKSYSATESGRNMLKDTVVTFPSGDDPNDWSPLTLDGPWGEFELTGRYRQTAATVWGHCALKQEQVPGTIFIGAALPIRQISVKEVAWTDQTDPTADLMNQTAIDLFTSRLTAYTKKVGALDIGAWSAQGAGDLSIFAGWAYDITRGESNLHRGRLQASIGALLPTGTQRNEDKALSVAFGHDGSFGIPVALSADICFENGFKVGVNADLTWFASKQRERRLKTDTTQTSYLLLSKGKATLRPGRLWRAALCAKHRMNDQICFSLLYNLQHQELSEYTTAPDGFNLTTINTANHLKAWSTHDITAKVHLRTRRTKEVAKNETSVSEMRLNLFYTYPISGRNTVRNQIIGAEICAAF